MKMFYKTLDNDSRKVLIKEYFILVDIGIDDVEHILHGDFNGSKLRNKNH